jgi:hypothetical protein
MNLSIRNFRLHKALMTVLCAGVAVAVHGQQASTPQDQPAAVATADLPDSPGVLMGSPSVTFTPPGDEFNDDDVTTIRDKPARKYHRVVHPDEETETLSAVDKLNLSILSRLTLGDGFSTVFAAGFSQLRDSKPHTGTDSGAFGERLGLLAIKQTSQSIFSYGIYAAAFHDDPRYYIMGPGHNVGIRAVYSASRLVVTKNDEGKAVVNWPKLAGIVSSNALTNAYYPQEDHGLKNLGNGIAASLGTSILTSEIHEFIGDAISLIHHKH